MFTWFIYCKHVKFQENISSIYLSQVAKVKAKVICKLQSVNLTVLKQLLQCLIENSMTETTSGQSKFYQNQIKTYGFMLNFKLLHHSCDQLLLV